MLKDANYQKKFQMLESWMPKIVEVIKKEIKNDHLRKDNAFMKQYLPGKNVNRLTTEEISQGYLECLKSGEGEQLGDFIATRWLLKNTELYYFFEERMKQISENFGELNEIEKSKAIPLMNEAVSQFGAYRTYLFSVLNSVVFPKEIFQQLELLARSHEDRCNEEARVENEQASLDTLKRDHAQEIARLSDRYEKKLLGLQRKYSIDVEMLKKQVANLQRRYSKVEQ
jgi:hypothetical protein